ncbi:uncharacterized protein Z519_12104 [Cladophialophora bantiana CBS 173.52]|uniref:Uncharacterized protein n=1 Tax=Cladophialophora bantiana (strain ATCC 10958 / CBS 173.52 / CDC B-1940 / NIH 8579) TaxID=1442370 RepID=A0A0D2FKI3_CLAB1|nr:uncharacterized protein Z519_12104 [Cladophialophora bantiana CBS 173.52]KIW87202.1 hypothetical protein Z519_12104 [Cladophialophora bantiana CBS 173.52]
MKACEQCVAQEKEYFYDAWDRCVACTESGHTCWPPINLDELMDKIRELRTLRSDAEHLRIVLNDKVIKLKSTQEVFVQHKYALNQASSDADRLFLSQLQKQGRSQSKDVEDDKKKYEIMGELIQKKLREKEDMAHALADLELDRFAQDCEHCTRLQQVCNFPTNLRICTTCRTAVVRCTGGLDWDSFYLMWNAVDPLDQQIDEYLLNNLSDPATFQELKSDEARAWMLLQPYFGRSGLSTQEQQESSHLSKERQQIRKSLEQIRTSSFNDDTTYQELLSLREVLTICANTASRWWSEYDVELEEWTGYPTQRGLPDVEDMTEAQFRAAVAWVHALKAPSLRCQI